MDLDVTECLKCGTNFLGQDGEVLACPECDTEVEASATVCPGCGIKFITEEIKPTSTIETLSKLLIDRQSESPSKSLENEAEIEQESKVTEKIKPTSTIVTLSKLLMDRSSVSPSKSLENEAEIVQESISPQEQESKVTEEIEPISTIETPQEDMEIVSQPSAKKKSKMPFYIAVVVVSIIVLIFGILYISLRGSENNPFAGITDSDGDGYNDNVDAFINDPKEWKDTDGDGVGNNVDAYPNDPNEWKDTDGDGVGDKTDIYDEGNGGIFFDILLYDGDGGYDTGEYGDLDPYFTIWMDMNGDGEIDTPELSQSETYIDTDNITHPHNCWVDVEDDLESIQLGVWVFDNDFSYPDDVIDINSSALFESINITYYPAIMGDLVKFKSDGSDDNASHEDDAYIECAYGICEL